MKFSIVIDNRELSDWIVYNIIHSIDKAISEDVPNQRHELSLETKNYISFIRGDFINENLRKFVVDIEKGILLHTFQRFGWSGRLLIIKDSRLTISIMTENNLARIQKKDRKNPHFIQSILHCMNGDLHGRYEQTQFFDTDPFDSETYDKDFNKINNGAIDLVEGYRHCIISYSLTGKSLTDVRFKVLDPKFNIVCEENLSDYIKPDFASLTANDHDEATAREEHNKLTNNLISLKPGLKLRLRVEDKEA